MRGKNSGFTLIELLMAIIILVPLFSGVMATFIGNTELAEQSLNASIALSACKNQISLIEMTLFSAVVSTFHNSTFTADGLTGIGSVSVESLNSDMLRIIVTFCWKERSGFRPVFGITDKNDIMNFRRGKKSKTG